MDFNMKEYKIQFKIVVVNQMCFIFIKLKINIYNI